MIEIFKRSKEVVITHFNNRKLAQREWQRLLNEVSTAQNPREVLEYLNSNTNHIGSGFEISLRLRLNFEDTRSALGFLEQRNLVDHAGAKGEPPEPIADIYYPTAKGVRLNREIGEPLRYQR